MDWSEFLKSFSMYAIMVSIFQFGIFFSIARSNSSLYQP